jgi:hypothetical protein
MPTHNRRISRSKKDKLKRWQSLSRAGDYSVKPLKLLELMLLGMGWERVMLGGV